MAKKPTKELQVEWEATSSLVPYARNSKQHTKAQVEHIANSISEFGFLDPVGVWTNADGESEIVEGHGRVLAAQKLGLDKVPVIHLDALTDAQRRAYTIAHNSTSMETEFDFQVLDDELDLLVDWDFSNFGLDMPDLEWADGLPELTEETYKEPDHKRLRCPACGHVDNALRFLKVEGDE